MNSIDLINVMDSILIKNQIPVTIHIDGEWGIGKTTVVKKWALREEKKVNFKYVSVFGKNSMEEIEKSLILQLLSIKEEQTAGIKIFGNLIRDYVAHKHEYEISLDKYTSNLSIEDFSYDKTQKKRKIVLCIDDLERKSDNIKIKDLMGLIERASENFDVIVIGSVERISEDNSIFNEYKEKVIDYIIQLDKVSSNILNSIANEKLNEFSVTTVEKIINIYIGNNNSSDETGYEYNLRLFKKYIDLVYRLSEEIKNTSIKDFDLSDNVLKMCKTVILSYFKYDNKFKNSQLDINKNLFNILNDLFLFRKINHSKLEEELSFSLEIKKDIAVLSEAYKSNEKDLNEVINKINQKIKVKDKLYFKKQEHIILLIDAFAELGICNEKYMNDLLEIAKDLLELSIGNKPKLFNEDDYLNVGIYGPEPCSIFTSKFISQLNDYNNDKYTNYIFIKYTEALNQMDFVIIDKILDGVHIQKIERFEEMFNLINSKLKENFDEILWNLIIKLINKTNNNLIKNYFSQMCQKEDNFLLKLRYKWLHELVDENLYFEHKNEDN